jgi:ABC-type bacteriocin/lantibiotic exporter with double-glycine peptidase domain
MSRKFSSNYLYLQDILDLLPRSDKRKILCLGLIQFFISIFDLAGLLLIAVVTSLGLNIISLVPIPSSLNFILGLPVFRSLPLERVVIVLALFAAFLLILKTLTNALITKKVTGFLALREAHLSSQYMNFVATSSPKWQLSKSPQYIAGVAMEGANSAITLSLGQVVSLLVECCSILLLFIGISTIDPSITFPSLIFFIVSGWVSVRFLTKRTRSAGRENYFLGISSSELVKNIVTGSRELYVSNKQHLVMGQFANQRLRNYQAVRTKALVAVIPKYISEITMVFGGVLIAGLQFALKDAKDAITGIVVFTALSSRLLPSLLRVQGAILQIRGSSEATKNFLEEFQAAKNVSNFTFSPTTDFRISESFIGSIKLENVSARHPEEVSFELTNISLDIAQGEFLAIIGPSGSGKTTLVDVMLGIVSPSSGSTSIAGQPPIETIRMWPNMIRYVPQDVQLINGSILENIIWPDSSSALNELEIRKLLGVVELETWVDSLTEGVNTRINSLGTNVSGGQKQRIGIARALYVAPQILFLDESTSALDAQTEKEIIEKILGRMDSLTRIVIAHRISTIKDADRIVYIENGAIKAMGNFQEIVEQVPSFGVDLQLE